MVSRCCIPRNGIDSVVNSFLNSVLWSVVSTFGCQDGTMGILLDSDVVLGQWIPVYGWLSGTCHTWKPKQRVRQ